MVQSSLFSRDYSSVYGYKIGFNNSSNISQGSLHLIKVGDAQETEPSTNKSIRLSKRIQLSYTYIKKRGWTNLSQVQTRQLQDLIQSLF